MKHPRLDPRKYEVTAADIRQRLRYDPETGQFTRLFDPSKSKDWNTKYAGKQAGSLVPSLGRWTVSAKINGKKFRWYGYQIAWLLMTGEWPSGEIDHRDTDKSNDRWVNLRPATSSQNKANKRLTARNKLGFKGVSLDQRRGTYSAEAKFGDVRIRKSGFATAEEAAVAYADAATKLHGEFARTA